MYVYIYIYICVCVYNRSYIICVSFSRKQNSLKIKQNPVLGSPSLLMVGDMWPTLL